eukprot:scaffold1481_cov137-Cylindrotheca_fusiformis.AAC.5
MTIRLFIFPLFWFSFYITSAIAFTCIDCVSIAKSNVARNGSISGVRIWMGREDEQVDEFGSAEDSMRRKRSNYWVIVVDDEEPIRKAVGQLLYDRGYQVSACADGNGALKVALRKRKDTNGNTLNETPDCIVSDVRMPGMDGIELLKKIRDDRTLMEVPVVLVTAKGMTQDRIAGYDSGADAYITKPFDPDELVAVVDNAIERHETLNGAQVQVDDLRRELDEIKHLLLEEGGGGVGNGWVEKTNVFLAPDEREVLEFLCKGLMTKEIASETLLSSRRVEQLLTRMFRKTGAKNRTELVRWAVSTGNVKI